VTLQSPLVDAHWLASRLGAPGAPCVLDASWHAATAGRDARAEFAQGHIPSARFFGLEDIADPASDLTHTLPPPAHLAARAAAVGARRGRTVVLYDDAGTAPSARAWWVLRTYGFADVRVLDGGLRAWREAGLPLEQGMPPALNTAPEDLGPADARRIADHAGVRSAIEDGNLVLDARPAARFRGEAAEPVPGIRSGHIPGSVNLPNQQLLDPATGRFLPADALRARLREAGVDTAAPVICTCGSGVTACVLALALDTIGHERVAVYDGSWTDWARRTSQEVIA
jgi:thiosulfate/3-mercaptopyruvate sulfurtransferase